LKIFYSWQSDINNKFNRNFIKDCLERAIKQLSQELEIEDALRLDHDTKGVEGSPDIANTILNKIEKSDIFIGDITFIAKSEGEKYCPNPNVLIELGYALNALGDGRVINIMNSSFGTPDKNLPFDLAHKRWPIIYSLDEDSQTDKSTIRNELVASIKSALYPYIGKSKSTAPVFASPAEKVKHRETLRKEFEGELSEIRAKKLRSDVIIRDVDRVDGYPNTNEEETGISAWFRLGMLETYTKGVKVLLRIGNLTQTDNGLRYSDHKTGEKGDIKAFLIGEIPFDSIVAVNWEGDEYYYFPHIYCHFDHGGEPYDRLIFCEEVDMGHGHTYFKEIAEHAEIQKNSEESGVEYFA
jgi:hypothetical protein